MKNIKYTFIFSMIIMITMSFCSNKKQKKQIVWKETIGTLPYHGNNSEGTVEYYVNGIKYSQFFEHRNDEARKDDKYTMRYNVDDPSEIEVDYWNPVFIEAEKTLHVVAKIDKLQKKTFWNEAPFVVFSYHINNTLLQKYVYLPPNYKVIYPNLSVGQYYQAECWEEDVNRVVLHLNKPIKDR